MNTRNSRLKLKDSTNNNRLISIVVIVFFTVGTCIMLAALFNMLVNLHKSDSNLMAWVLFLITGLLLVVIGVLINHTKNLERDKQKKRSLIS
jgi:fatty acid desaturase